MDPVLSYIYEKEGTQRMVLEHLHALISSYPEITYKIRYKVPFYFHRSWVCYLNPIKKDGVELAFLRANEMSNENGLLDFKDRKQVAGVSYYDVKEIDETTLLPVLEEALLLDQTIKYASKRKRNR